MKLKHKDVKWHLLQKQGKESPDGTKASRFPIQFYVSAVMLPLGCLDLHDCRTAKNINVFLGWTAGPFSPLVSDPNCQGVNCGFRFGIPRGEQQLMPVAALTGSRRLVFSDGMRVWVLSAAHFSCGFLAPLFWSLLDGPLVWPRWVLFPCPFFGGMAYFLSAQTSGCELHHFMTEYTLLSSSTNFNTGETSQKRKL